jgi:hypothetical protein
VAPAVPAPTLAPAAPASPAPAPATSPPAAAPVPPTTLASPPVAPVPASTPTVPMTPAPAPAAPPSVAAPTPATPAPFDKPLVIHTYSRRAPAPYVAASSRCSSFIPSPPRYVKSSPSLPTGVVC